MAIVPDNYSLGWVLGGSAHYQVLLKLLLIAQIMVVCRVCRLVLESPKKCPWAMDFSG